MKRITAIAAAIIVGLTAVSAARAADDVYRTGDGKTFSTRNVFKVTTFQADTRYVQVHYANGGSSSFRDTDGLLERVLANQPELTQIDATTYVNPLYLGSASCTNGKSVAFVQTSVMTITADDGCALVNAIAAKAK